MSGKKEASKLKVDQNEHGQNCLHARQRLTQQKTLGTTKRQESQEFLLGSYQSSLPLPQIQPQPSQTTLFKTSFQQSQLLPQPQVQPQSQPQTQPQSQSMPQREPQLQPKTQPQSEHPKEATFFQSSFQQSQLEPILESRLEPKLEAQPQKPIQQSLPQSKTQPESEPKDLSLFVSSFQKKKADPQPDVEPCLQLDPQAKEQPFLHRPLQKLDTEPTYEQILDKVINLTKQLANFTDQEQTEDEIKLHESIKDLLSFHIVVPFMHPEAISTFGERLLKDGKFSDCFIQFITHRREKQEFLIKYLYVFFEDLVTENVDIFQEQKDKLDQTHVIILSAPKEQFQSESSHLNTSIAVNVNSDAGTEFQDPPLVNLHQRSEAPKRGRKKGSKSKKKTQNQTGAIKRPDMTDKRTKKHKAQQAALSQSRSKSITPKKSTNGNRLKIQQQKEDFNSAAKKESPSLKHQEDPNQQSHQEDSKLGSRYKYELRKVRSSKKTGLSQVRVSARLQSKRKSNRQSQSQRKSQPQRKSGSKSNSKTDDDSIEQMLEVDWIREHLKELDVSHVTMYDDFKAMTTEDAEITKFLKELEKSSSYSNRKEEEESNSKRRTASIDRQNKQSQASSKHEESDQEYDSSTDYQGNQGNQDQLRNEHQQGPPIESQVSQNIKKRKQQFLRNKEIYKVKEEFPLTIEEVTDSDINGHGIYALLKLGRVTQFQMGTKYALTPLTDVSLARKTHIIQDLLTAKQISGVESREQLGHIKYNYQIDAILKEHAEKNKK